MRIPKSLGYLVLLLVVAGCSTTLRKGGTSQQSGEAGRKAIESVAQIQGTGSIRGTQGKTYSYFRTDDAGAQAATKAARVAEDVEAAAEDDVVLTDDNTFTGEARAQAKTTLAHAKLEKFASLSALVDSLPTDAEMLSYQPKITRDTPRVKEESRNVGLCVFIFATKNEADNDYHIIIGDGDGLFLNVEMSGLPTWGTKKNRRALSAARDTFESFVDSEGRKTRTYTGWGDPVPIYLEGSLFYDTEHRPGKVGPEFARPKTSWEIHPISKILFEPGEELCNP